MKIEYVPKHFSTAHSDLIQFIDGVATDYANRGYDMTLRQIYYYLVSHVPDKFPRKWRWTGTKFVRDDINGTVNATPNYKWLGTIINDARLAGLLDWDHVTDRTRNIRSNPHWDSPQDIVNTCAKQFQIDKWDSQRNYVEVWVEKDALVGVLEVACKPLDVPYFSCRGYTSQSEMWSAAMRLSEHAQHGQNTYIIHLGDHDPSGIDMSRDIEERLTLFMEHDGCDRAIIRRVALNMDQVKKYKCPPNPAKLTDSRSKTYVNNFGDESWELDALDPAVITNLIEDAVADLRDEETWEKAVVIEQKHLKKLKAVARKWEKIKV